VIENVWKGAKLIYINIVLINAFSWAQKHCISLLFTSNIRAVIQKAYKIELLRVKHNGKIKKKSFLYIQTPPQPITYSLTKEICKWFWFIWTSTTLTTSNITFERARCFYILTLSKEKHFHGLRNTEYLCQLQAIYKPEYKKLTRLKFLRSNKHNCKIKNLTGDTERQLKQTCINSLVYSITTDCSKCWWGLSTSVWAFITGP
jgi:hypothetical protein